MSNYDYRNKFWHLLCHQSELPESGDYLRLKWLDEEVVIFNDCGEFVVFDNVCPHRGTRFFVDSHGNGKISCPYHRWSYSSGKMHIPCRESYAEADLANAKINQLKIDWCGSFIFASIIPVFSLEEQLGNVYDLLANISFNINGRTDFNQYDFECDWRVAVENALEPLHVPYVHPDSLGKLELMEGHNEFNQWSSIWYSPVGNARMLKQLKNIKSLFAIDYQYEGYMFIYLFPFTTLSSTYGYSYALQNFFPSESNDKTFFTSRLLNSVTKNEAAFTALQGFFNSSAEINRKVFAEDHEICKRISNKFIASQGVLSTSEDKIAHFRECLEKDINANT